jgi:transcriptional regulator with XRE-family HTH domain
MNLKDIRTLLVITPTELEREARVSRGTVQDIETGRNANPTVKVITKLLKALRGRYGLPGAQMEHICRSDAERRADR